MQDSSASVSAVDTMQETLPGPESQMVTEEQLVSKDTAAVTPAQEQSSVQSPKLKRGADELEGTDQVIVSPKRQRRSTSREPQVSDQPAPTDAQHAPSNEDTTPSTSALPPPSATSPSQTTTNTTTTSPSQPRRAPKPIDERTRTRRLFGGVLGSLSAQSRTSDAGSRRRKEVEERKHQEAKRREAELAARQEERAEALREARVRRQDVVQERDLRVRHGNMRARARFLRTVAQPVLCFKPWEMRPEEEARIQRQLEDVEVDIAREMDEFEESRRIKGKALRVDDTEQTDDARMDDAANGAPRTDDAHMDERTDEGQRQHGAHGGPAQDEPSDQTTNGTTVAKDLPLPEANVSRDPIDKINVDESGDVVDDAGEDEVMY